MSFEVALHDAKPGLGSGEPRCHELAVAVLALDLGEVKVGVQIADRAMPVARRLQRLEERLFFGCEVCLYVARRRDRLGESAAHG